MDDEIKGQGEFRSTPAVQTALILGATFGIRPVQYAEIEGLAIFEGDIVLGAADQVLAQTEQLRMAATGQIEMGVVRSGAQFRWPNCRIPYDIDAALPNQTRVTDAIGHWQANTRFRFILRTPANAASYPDWVTFRPGSGCSSMVGRQGGQQFVNLGAGCTTGNVIHEIGHVVGLWHEQSREDRDSFVTVHWDKIQPGLEHNFNQHVTDGDDVGPYDYGSIMHYPRNAFSVDGSDTITPVDPTAQIGQRNGLSAGDVSAANSMCPKSVKEGVLDTRKERVKDIRLDTQKEIILDTRKEAIRDTRKELIRDPIKHAALDPPFPPPPVRPPLSSSGGGVPGAVPFAVATPHHAPGAGEPPATEASSLADAIAQLDAHLQGLSQAVAETEASRDALQQQYDETKALLDQTLDTYEEGSDGQQ